MSVWVERDAATGQVVLVSETKRTLSKAEAKLAGVMADGGFGTRTSRISLRLSPAQARVLAARLVAASDEELEGVVAVVQDIGDTVQQAASLFDACGDFLKRAVERLGSDDSEDLKKKVSDQAVFCPRCLTRRVKGTCPSCEGP